MGDSHADRREPTGRRSRETTSRHSRERKLDLAARAAWLYYIAGDTQEAIATKLEVSRQAAQRLVALA
ncbi:MAG: sugar-binding transcriptional regulator, partial [Cyanobacteria bacterium J06636_16]